MEKPPDQSPHKKKNLSKRKKFLDLDLQKRKKRRKKKSQKRRSTVLQVTLIDIFFICH